MPPPHVLHASGRTGVCSAALSCGKHGTAGSTSAGGRLRASWQTHRGRGSVSQPWGLATPPASFTRWRPEACASRCGSARTFSVGAPSLPGGLKARAPLETLVQTLFLVVTVTERSLPLSPLLPPHRPNFLIARWPGWEQEAACSSTPNPEPRCPQAGIGATWDRCAPLTQARGDLWPP